MEQKLKDAWVIALRSGEYKQAVGALRRGPKDPANDTGQFAYCCIGVLCEVSKTNLPSNLEMPVEEFIEDVKDEIESCNFPSPPILAILGLESAERTRLVKMNDTDLLPFAEIADWIERNIPVTI
jgi:hypothetical protein